MIPAFYTVIPILYTVIPTLYPRHSRESGNPDGCSQARRPKSSMNPNQRIPSPFMDLQAQVDAEFSETIVAPPLRLAPAIPAKAGIQTAAIKLATRNQVQIPTSGSLLPLWAYRG